MKGKKGDSDATWTDADDAPELTEEWFAGANLYEGDQLVRAGRPKQTAAKEAVSIRLDRDVVAYFRSTGPGWRSRINAALRKAAGI